MSFLSWVVYIVLKDRQGEKKNGDRNREDKMKGKKEKRGQGRQKRDMEIESCSFIDVNQGDVST